MTLEEKIITQLRVVAATYGIEGLELRVTTDDKNGYPWMAYVKYPEFTLGYGTNIGTAVESLWSKIKTAPQVAAELRASADRSIKRAEALEAGKV